MMGAIHTAVVLVNYRRPDDTVKCVQSLLRMSSRDWSCVIYENGSGDTSSKDIRSGLSALNPESARQVDSSIWSYYFGGGRTVLFEEGGRNLGFAGGNNAGLVTWERVFGIKAPFVWFLNNDTEVDPNCLNALVAYASSAESGRTGIVGATVRYHAAPQLVQCFGGASYDAKFGRVVELGKGRKYVAAEALNFDSSALSYICGASLFVTREFLDVVGPMSEDYFLYFEELDWAERGRQAGFSLGYEPRALVYHKEGAALGSGGVEKRSVLAEFYGLRSRMRFTAKFYPKYFVLVYMAAVAQLAKRILQGRPSQARALSYALAFRSSPPRVVKS